MGAGIHFGHEGLSGRRRRVAKGVRGIVGRLNDERVEQIFDGKDLVVLQPNLGAAHAGVFGGDGHGSEERDLLGLDRVLHDEEGHQLRHTGGRPDVVFFLGKQHRAIGGVDDVGAFEHVGERRAGGGQQQKADEFG